MRKRVYIAGPIGLGDLADNIDLATEAFVRLAKAGLAPMCPHWSCYCGPVVRLPDGRYGAYANRDGDARYGLTADDWYGLDLKWVAVSEAVLRLPGVSRGADLETACAREHGIPVFYDIETLLAWAAPAAPPLLSEVPPAPDVARP